ncbi:MAG: MotA/TolQ/ExbB proton channel family protein [Bacteroidia bacterium]|nr:MotA/TolQ/ExbB proton channel family protein [Bacteroidia bacterium]
MVIPVSLGIAILVFLFIMGASSNFQGNNSDNAPIPGNFLGVIYKGGFIVPVIMMLLLTVITFSLERFFTISKAGGKGSAADFVEAIKDFLAENNIKGAIEECDKFQGSIASVSKAALIKYTLLEKDTTMTKEQKLLDIQKNIEEATSLELPSLEQNLPALATISSVATMMGLLGTVLGMIRSFAAMANAGAPDSVALSTGISEALINTAFGIGTGALAVVMYNFFTTKIDKLTYSIDEAGYSIVQTFAAKH